jgi:hypothetical protein
MLKTTTMSRSFERAAAFLRRQRVMVRTEKNLAMDVFLFAEGDYPGEPPTPQQLAEIRAVLEAAGVEFTDGNEPGVRLSGAPNGVQEAR